MERFSDTIAAIATPHGVGGIAVLRISGARTRFVLSRLFKSHGRKVCKAEEAPLASMADCFSFQPRHMHYGTAHDAAGGLLDTVLAVYMPGPASFTGEDVGEIHCHGGVGVTSALLEASFAAGARLAEPGEFTRRAFLNGRLDLAQAEAVAELIHAPTRTGARLAAAKLHGALSREILAVRRAVDALRVQVTLAVDFSEENIELLSDDVFRAAIHDAIASMERLLAGFQRARLWREGMQAVLVGRVNVGKSSLLNALLGRERAIVSALPGTTRDYIEESISIQGMPLRLTDTAGLRQGGDIVEMEGILRSSKLAEEADLVLLVLDVCTGIQSEEIDFLQAHADTLKKGRLLVILNKIDALNSIEPDMTSQSISGEKNKSAGLLPENDSAFLENWLGKADARYAAELQNLLISCPCYLVSAQKGLGLDALANGIFKTAHTLQGLEPQYNGAGDIAPNLRQSQLLTQAIEELRALVSAHTAGYPPDILSVHLETAATLLGTVTGFSNSEAVLDEIFSSFCIGK